MKPLLCIVLCGLIGISPHLPAQQVSRTLAERLGYKATDRLLIIHADDAGMCHSVNRATIQAMEKGVVTSASIMVPCPWMPEIAAYCREHPEADFGLHLTLTSEWRYYRWRPVTAITEVPGLLDREGFLHRSVEDVVRNATPAEVEKEIRAQIQRALDFGIRPTHVDSHMGTLFTGPFIHVYTRVAKEFGLLPMLMRATPERIAQARLLGFDAEKLERELTPRGYVFLDTLHETVRGDTLEARREFFYNLFRNLKPGVTEVIVHLALDDEEIRNITNSWRARYHEYLILTDPKTRELIDSLGIKLIGYRDLMKLAYKPEAASTP
ncbi:MAG: polysaccharide deacetylase family protein [Chloroherpetonaceae bacterium]|nr:polysaccharide deacetylase family protein [Chthonomonadaceae bacterium]MDW8209164.1 polysaccharide deacetylase family protein [Chloroherpetonaceae bacterium]